MECTICVEKLNKSTRKPVECVYCQFKTCHKCVEKYLIENTITPQCMSCKREWNMEFLRTCMSRSFMDKQYRNHQKDALLAEAEATVGRWQDLAKMQDQRAEVMEELQEAKDELDAARRRMEKLRDKVWEMDRAIYRMRGVEGESSERREFFMACPLPECRGKLSTAYKCGMCEHWICPDCHVDKGMERDGAHTCKQDDVDTVKLLKDNTRPCPKCHMGIYKTMGCDQMWCVQCQTCFSWRTGNILNGVVHNPHFYEFQRRQAAGGVAPRVPGDIPCGGLPTMFEMRRRLREDRETPASGTLFEIHRLIGHLTDIVMPSVYRKFNARPHLHRDVGVLYLRNQITREAWRDGLYKAVRQEEKFRRYYQVLETLTTNLAEFLRQWVNGEDTARINKTCETLFDYANEETTKMRKQFTMKLPVFHARMIQDHNYY